MKILCLLTDIFFIPEIQKKIPCHSVSFIESYNGEAFDLLVLDMDHRESLVLCSRFPEKSFCFWSHMDTEKMEKFKATGCKNIYPRSVFLKKLLELSVGVDALLR